MEITVTAPNRVDLAGGTTDLYPLYLFMDGGCTVNAAVSVYSHVTLRETENSAIRIQSTDLGTELSASSIEDLPVTGPLGLVCRAIRAVPPSTGLEVVTRNEAPAGSGLGASSALLTALLTGLYRMAGISPEPSALISLATAVETGNLGIPAGTQDYIAAYFGGVSCIDFGLEGFERRSPELSDVDWESFSRTILVSFTGEKRFSGLTNWAMLKSFVDDTGQTRDLLIAIRDIARNVVEALFRHSWDEVPSLVDREWYLRKALADGVSTPTTDAVMTAAKEAGAKASKICGAGGGGCMISIVSPEVRPRVEEAIRVAGGTPLSAGLVRRGCTVTVHE